MLCRKVCRRSLARILVFVICLERTRISGPVAHFTGLPAPAWPCLSGNSAANINCFSIRNQQQNFKTILHSYYFNHLLSEINLELGSGVGLNVIGNVLALGS
jgi:hypothetical protein